MPRNSSGVYSLPAGNPVVSGTTIASTWANTTLPDIGSELTNSLDRSGRGGMLAPLKGIDGIVTAPLFAFTNEPTTGFWRKSAGVLSVSIIGTEIGSFQSTGWVGPVVGHSSLDLPLTGGAMSGAISSTFAGGALSQSSANVGALNFLATANTDNTSGASAAQLQVVTGGASGGDASINWTVLAATSWIAGIDNSDSDRWKLSFGSALGTSDYAAVSAAGLWGFGQITGAALSASAAEFIGGANTMIVRGPLGATTGYQGIRVYNDLNSSARALEMDYSGSAYASALLTNGPTGEQAVVVSNGNFPLTFGTNNTARLGITGAGVVGYYADGGASAFEVGFRGLPQNVISTTYSLVASDRGKSVKQTGVAAITVPNGVFSAGDVTYIYNDCGVSITIIQGAGTTARWGTGTPTTGNRILANSGGITIYWVTASIYKISGDGLS